MLNKKISAALADTDWLCVKSLKKKRKKQRLKIIHKRFLFRVFLCKSQFLKQQKKIDKVTISRVICKDLFVLLNKPFS